MRLDFEWDPNKAEKNLKKHHVSFEEASSVFDDPLSANIEDATHSTKERRFLIIGYSIAHRILLVVYNERGGNIRIISARPATRQEVEIYEEGE